MIANSYKKTVIITACLLAATSLSGLVAAQSTSASGTTGTQSTTSKQEATAIQHVNDAVAVVRRMETEPGMNKLLQQAKGVFIVPTYGRAAFVVGGSGGAGVLLAKRDDGVWGDPAFYNIGSLSVGAQAGVEGGPITLVLNNDKALNKFMQKNNFSISADTGLTVINWAKVAQDSVGTGDVVAWAGTKGLFGNVITLGINDIRFNQSTTNAYYHQTVDASDVIKGKVKNAQAATLREELARISTAATSGSSGASPSRGMSGGPAGESSGNTGTSNK